MSNPFPHKITTNNVSNLNYIVQYEYEIDAKMKNTITENKRSLFVYAHLDDETILSYGTIQKHLVSKDSVTIVVLCGDGRDSRAAKQSQKDRLDVFYKIYDNIPLANLKVFGNNDLTLTHDSIKRCLDTIDFDDYDVIYTHSIHDLHFEHRLVAEEVIAYCRPNVSSVKELYSAATFTSAQGFGQFGAFLPNTFIDVEKHMNAKKKSLLQYSMEFSGHGNNDIRSVESIIDWNRHNGKVVNLKYVEPYEQVFRIS